MLLKYFISVRQPDNNGPQEANVHDRKLNGQSRSYRDLSRINGLFCVTFEVYESFEMLHNFVVNKWSVLGNHL